MKIDACDICYYKDSKLVEAVSRIGFTHGVKVGVCKEHKSWGKDFKTSEIFYANYQKMQQPYWDKELAGVKATFIN